MKIYIRPNAQYSEVVKYVLKLIEKNTHYFFDFVDDPQKAEKIWNHEDKKSEVIAIKFYTDLFGINFNTNKDYFSKFCYICDSENRKDCIATIFFMVNCLQEYNVSGDDLDNHGRFKFNSSYQAKFSVTDLNLVQIEIDNLFTSWGLKGIKRDSRFFISHDIDTIYSSFLEDGFWALKNMKISVILKLFIYEVLKNPHWKNIDFITKLNSEYDIRSTFFWLVNKGTGLGKIKNADYDIKKERGLLNLVEERNFINGLHKSSSEDSIEDELNKLDLPNCYYNRYHFLKCLPHTDWVKISNSPLLLDSSLGFAEHYGFRNSYGKSFQPFDLLNRRPYNFIETPVLFMDITFHKYMCLPKEKIGDIIIDFYGKNSKNCDVSLIWHNNYFTDYKYNSFIKQYIKIIEFIYENKINCVTPQELIQENIITW